MQEELWASSVDLLVSTEKCVAKTSRWLKSLFASIYFSCLFS